MKNLNYVKWLSSTKFQIAVMCIVLIYLQQEFYGLSPEIVTDALLKITLAYFSARIVEPVVEFLIGAINKRKES